ncbi:GSCOCG00003411001-RA-CDS [Cotesia congregata]|nr:GSCOCG00003411001-RA-CDS [Cotesia congregata]
MATRLSERKKIQSLLKVTFGSATVFAGTCMYQGNEKFYNQVLMPLVTLVDPEIAHNLAVTAAKWGFISEPRTPDSSALNQKVFGLKFSNPVGMAAGFDKQGEAIKGLTKMGFGFVEIDYHVSQFQYHLFLGSVTPNPQPGNPKPRVFRLTEDKAIINRYGFNSEGHEAVYKRLLDLRSDSSFTGIIGVNLGKNKTSTDPVADYVEGVKKFSDVADYLVINVSSPNTEGLRDLQGKEHLEKLLSSINSVRQSMKSYPPLLLKLAPDLTNNQRQDVAEIIQKSKCKVDGLILSNTTISRRDLSSEHKNETGGLSGAPLTDLSTDLIADMYKRTNGKIPIVGVGGIFSGKDAFDKIKAGASLIQIYTSYAYHGPPIVQKIKKELNDLIVLNGYSSITDAVGKNVK